MADSKRRIALLVAGLAIAAGVGIGVVVVGIPMLGAYFYIHAHDHREFAESAPTLVGIRADDGRLTVHVNLCGETLEAVRVVSWEEDSPEPLPIWRASMPRGGSMAEPGTFRLDESGQFGRVSGALPGSGARHLWVEISTKQNEYYASSRQFAIASLPADLPPGVYWTEPDHPPRSALDIDLLAPCATPGAY